MRGRDGGPIIESTWAVVATVAVPVVVVVVVATNAVVHLVVNLVVVAAVVAPPSGFQRKQPCGLLCKAKATRVDHTIQCFERVRNTYAYIRLLGPLCSLGFSLWLTAFSFQALSLSRLSSLPLSLLAVCTLSPFLRSAERGRNIPAADTPRRGPVGMAALLFLLSLHCLATVTL